MTATLPIVVCGWGGVPAAAAPDASASNQIVLKEASSDRVAAWSDTEVRTWLTSLSPALASYGDVFATAGVTGKTLLTLQDADLEAMGVANRVHRVRMLKEINRLRE